jgi:hypothetical protein
LVAACAIGVVGQTRIIILTVASEATSKEEPVGGPDFVPLDGDPLEAWRILAKPPTTAKVASTDRENRVGMADLAD